MRVANLKEHQQREIARRIRSGEDPAAVVTSYLAPPSAAPGRPTLFGPALARFVHASVAAAVVESRLDLARPSLVNDHVAELERLRDLIKTLLDVSAQDPHARTLSARMKMSSPRS